MKDVKSKGIRLDGPSEVALSNLQDTKLSPMEEALFRSWAKANQVNKPDAADDYTDYRGIYKQTGGKVLPYGQLPMLAKEQHSKQIIKRRLIDAFTQDKGDGGVESIQKQQENEQKHKQQMEMQQEKSKNLMIQKEANEPGPNQLRSQELENEGKQIDLEKVLLSRVSNEGEQ